MATDAGPDVTPSRSILGLPGSLRPGSTNHLLLAAVPGVDPRLTLELYEGVGELPHYRPDLDAEGALLPPEVRSLRARLARADGLIVSSPEYVHGMPGSLKNALDWLVSGPEIMTKPTLLWCASPSGAPYAHPQLLEVLGTMTTGLVGAASLRLTRARHAFDADGALVDETLRAELAGSLAALCAVIAPGSPR